MSWKLFGVLLYLAILLFIGAAASRRMKDIRDYVVGGKRMGFWVVAFSARATGESAWLLLGLTGMGAAVGVQAFWVVLGEILGVSGAWLLMSRRFKRLTDRYDAITVPDYLEERFRDAGHRLRLVSAGALVVFVTIYVSAQIDATGTAFESFLGWNYYVGALVGFVVVVAYIVSGGFVAVVWSDVFQGTLMFLGLVSLPVLGALVAGGPAAVLEGLRAQDPTLLRFTAGADVTAVFGTLALLLIGLGFLGSPQIFVRFISLRGTGEISKGAAVAIIWTILADTGAVLTGLVGRHLLARPGQVLEDVLGKGGQKVLPMLVEALVPALLVGLFIAVVLSAIMSTVDSLLVVASSSVVRDVHQKVRHPETPDAALIGLSRKVTFVLAALALAISMIVAVTTPSRTIFWFVIFGWSGISATFCPTMILSLVWPRMTARGALAAMVAGFVSVPFFKFLAPRLPVVGSALGALSELPPSFVISGITGVLVSLADRRGQDRLEGIAAELSAASEETPAHPPA